MDVLKRHEQLRAERGPLRPAVGLDKLAEAVAEMQAHLKAKDPTFKPKVPVTPRQPK